MYVKLKPWDGLNEVILQVPPESALHYGHRLSRVPPSERAYEDELNISIDFATIHGVHVNPAEPGDDDGDYWMYRWVWWQEEARGLIAAVTTGRIFIMSDDGRTIDKVR